MVQEQGYQHDLAVAEGLHLDAQMREMERRLALVTAERDALRERISALTWPDRNVELAFEEIEHRAILAEEERDDLRAERDALRMAPEPMRCPDCGGTGELGLARDGRLIACETCGGHEDALGTGRVNAPGLGAVWTREAPIIERPERRWVLMNRLAPCQAVVNPRGLVDRRTRPILYGPPVAPPPGWESALAAIEAEGDHA